MIKTLLALLVSLAVLSQAEASSLHLCPVPSYVGGSSTTLGEAPWTMRLPSGEAEMLVDADTIYCKIDGVLLSKPAPNKNCVLGAEAGKIIQPPQLKKYCTFADYHFRKENDCYVICP